MEQIDIEKLLQEGKIVQTKLRGYSMYPLFVPGREDVRIESCRQDSLHRGDVVLYRRTGGRLVLHRIHHIKNGKYYMVGDNQTEIEGPLEPEQIKGKMTAFIKNGKIIPEDNVYGCFSDHADRLSEKLFIFSKAGKRNKSNLNLILIKLSL